MEQAGALEKPLQSDLPNREQMWLLLPKVILKMIGDFPALYQKPLRKLSLGRKGLSVKCDINDEKIDNSMVQKTMDFIGHIDMLVSYIWPVY